MRIRVLLGIAALLAGSAAAAEQFYKWKDANGVWHYSSTKPPAGTEAESVSVKKGTPEAETTTTTTTTTTAGAGATTAAADAASPEALRAKRQAACTQARENIRLLETYPVVKMDLDNSGEAKGLTEAQHAEQLRNAREVAALACTE
jgi:hypothetical protein